MAFFHPVFSLEALDAARAHAVAEYPRESCGLIVAEAYRPCVNSASEPEKDFRISENDLLDVGAGLQAVLHSHPDGEGIPSAADMRGQMDSGVPWGIIACTGKEAQSPVWWGDFRLEEPLLGRVFVHGVTDCYSLIRSWFWQKRGLLLPDFARDADWWKSNKDLYRTLFASAGFRRIESAEARPGDVFIGQVRASVPNHGGILLEKGLGLHHLEGRLSRREPVGPWQRFITHWLRFVALPGE